MYVCMYVCMYAFMDACMYLCIHIYIYAWMHPYFPYLCAWMYLYQHLWHLWIQHASLSPLTAEHLHSVSRTVWYGSEPPSAMAKKYPSSCEGWRLENRTSVGKVGIIEPYICSRMGLLEFLNHTSVGNERNSLLYNYQSLGCKHMSCPKYDFCRLEETNYQVFFFK